MSSDSFGMPEVEAANNEEFVSDPGVGDKGTAGLSQDVSEQVAVLAHGMLSELQRIADIYNVDPAEMSHLARLITSSLEELDMMISEHSTVCAELEKLKGELEQLLRKLASEQEARQASEKAVWALQDSSDQERRLLRSLVEQLKLKQTLLQGKLNAKTEHDARLELELEELRQKNAEERSHQLKVIHRYTQQLETLKRERKLSAAQSAELSRISRSSLRPSPSTALVGKVLTEVPDPLEEEGPSDDAVEDMLEDKQSNLEAKSGAEEVRRLRRAETLSIVSDWEASMNVQGSDSHFSLQSELSAALSAPSDDEGANIESTPKCFDRNGIGDSEQAVEVDTSLAQDVSRLANESARLEQERVRLVKENVALRAQLENLESEADTLRTDLTLHQSVEDQLEELVQSLRQQLAQASAEISRAPWKDMVPDFSEQFKEEKQRLTKLYTFYKDKCQVLHKELCRAQSIRIDGEQGSSLRKLFARLLSGLRRRRMAAQGSQQATSPSVSETSLGSAPDANVLRKNASSESVLARDSSGQDQSSTNDSRPVHSQPDTPKTSRGVLSRSATTKSQSRSGSVMDIHAAAVAAAESVAPQSNKDDVFHVGSFVAAGDWLVGGSGKSVSSQRQLPGCVGQAALFSPEGSKIQCAVMTHCAGSSETMPSPQPVRSHGEATKNSNTSDEDDWCRQLWVCTKWRGSASQLEVMDVMSTTGSVRHSGKTIQLESTGADQSVLCMEFVPAADAAKRANVKVFSQPRSQPLVWLGTSHHNGHILLYSAKPGKVKLIQESFVGGGPVGCIRYFFSRVFVGLAAGVLLAFDRKGELPSGWCVENAQRCELQSETTERQLDVTCIEAVEGRLWCGCGHSIFNVDACALTVEFSFTVDARHPVSHIIAVGDVVVVATSHSSLLHFYHTRSSQLLHCLDTTPLHQLVEKEDPLQCRLKAITSLCLCDNTLWVGAGTGVLITLSISQTVTLLSARHGRVSLSPNPLLDEDVHQDVDGPSAVCSFKTAQVAQWCHWGAVRCLVPVKFSQKDEKSSSPTWAVFSGGLGTMDFRTATRDELKHRSAFTGFPLRARSLTVGATPRHQPQRDSQPLFQQFIMWNCAS